MQHSEKSEPKCDQQVGNTSNFEGVSNLNLKVDHSFNLKAECEKKDATIVPSSISEKSVQDEVYHAPMNLKFQTEDVPSLNVMS
jgi:sialic acid synthase SpsE